MLALWSRIALTPEESEVVRAFQIVDSRVERCASVLTEVHPFGWRGAMFVKVAGIESRVPLGNMGDGMGHILNWSLAVLGASGGTALIDEIETGLHYSVMRDMWRWVIETARRLDVQVFATTHSLDCVRGLAKLCGKNSSILDDVFVHRIELEKQEVVAYTAADLDIAMQQELELR